MFWKCSALTLRQMFSGGRQAGNWALSRTPPVYIMAWLNGLKGLKCLKGLKGLKCVKGLKGLNGLIDIVEMI